MREAWRPIEVDGTYSVSNFGRVRSERGRGAGTILVGSLNKSGYRQVALYFNGQYTHRRVAVLVTRAFLGPCPPGLEINHKDESGDKTDDRLSNLEYTTKSKNCLHRSRVLGKVRGEGHGRAKLTEQDVREIRRRYATGKETQQAIADDFNVGQARVSHVVLRKHWAHVE